MPSDLLRGAPRAGDAFLFDEPSNVRPSVSDSTEPPGRSQPDEQDRDNSQALAAFVVRKTGAIITTIIELAEEAWR